MALQKEADQQKRAAILQSEGLQQAAINTAQGEKQGSILRAEGQKQSAILRAEGDREAAIRLGEGRAGAIQATYDAIHAGNVTPELLAVLQLDALGRIASSDNAKLIVPIETAGLLGAAQALRSVLAAVPEAGATSSNGDRRPQVPPPPPKQG
jgi:regulator of protease activity HflC (stomatin/prohibitin superfamily)